MYTQLFDPTGTLMDLSGYALQASARFGGNGIGWMPPELVAGTGTDPASMATGRMIWDEDLSDGLDSGLVPFSFDGDLGGGTASFAAYSDSSSPAEFCGPTCGTVGSVVIRAGALVPASVSFSSVTVQFWNGDQVGEVLSLSGGVAVDTSSFEGGVGEQVLIVTPEATNYTRVTISGAFWMSALPDVMPGYGDIFGQVLIMPA